MCVSFQKILTTAVQPIVPLRQKKGRVSVDAGKKEKDNLDLDVLITKVMTDMDLYSSRAANNTSSPISPTGESVTNRISSEANYAFIIRNKI